MRIPSTNFSSVAPRATPPWQPRPRPHRGGERGAPTPVGAGHRPADPDARHSPGPMVQIIIRANPSNTRSFRGWMWTANAILPRKYAFESVVVIPNSWRAVGPYRRHMAINARTLRRYDRGT